MPSRRDRALLAAASTYILLSERKRRYWVRPSLQSKKVYSLTDLLTDLRADDTDPITGEINESGWFKNYTRISRDDFHLTPEVNYPICSEDRYQLQTRYISGRAVGCYLTIFSNGRFIQKLFLPFFSVFRTYLPNYLF